MAYRRRRERDEPGSKATPADLFSPLPWAARPPAAPAGTGAGRPPGRAAGPSVKRVVATDGVAPRHPAGADLVADLRAKADGGDVEGALRLVQTGLQAAPTDPVLFYYQGLLDQTSRRWAEAERAFRSAVYLDKNFVMAHYQLGLLLTSRGEIVAGRRAIAAAARLAAALASERELPEGDGLTAGVLARLARATLQPLASAR